MPTDLPIVFENADLALATSGPVLATAQDELVEAAMGFAAASRPPNTQLAYERQWRAFEAWCAGQGASALPAAPATLELYLTARARQGRKVSTLCQAIAAIARKHRDVGLDAPHKTLIVERTWDGIRRTLGSAPRRVAPATVDVLRKMSAALPSTPLLVLGFGGAFRRSELVALNVDDVSIQSEGLVVRVRSPRPTRLQPARVWGCAPAQTR